MTRRQKAGEMMADALIEWCHMMYNNNTAKGVIQACIDRLQQRQSEYVPRKKNSKAPFTIKVH